ncbi:MAG: hypothetical protein AAB401_22670 [Acidobacteriota bacterium]
MPAYQTFVARLNRLEATFQSLSSELQERLQVTHVPGIDRVIDSMPVMLAPGGHAYSAVVAREGLHEVGYIMPAKSFTLRCAVTPGIAALTLFDTRVGDI